MAATRADGIIADDKTHATAPSPTNIDTIASTSMEGGEGGPVIHNRALNAVLTALSNYNDDENEFDDDGSISTMDNHRHHHRPNGWGVESNIEGNNEWDRPVVLHGADGILTRHPHHQPNQDDDRDEFQSDFQSPYRVMEDMDLVDRLCVEEGSFFYTTTTTRYGIQQQLQQQYNNTRGVGHVIAADGGDVLLLFLLDWDTLFVAPLIGSGKAPAGPP